MAAKVAGAIVLMGLGEVVADRGEPGAILGGVALAWLGVVSLTRLPLGNLYGRGSGRVIAAAKDRAKRHWPRLRLRTILFATPFVGAALPGMGAEFLRVYETHADPADRGRAGRPGCRTRGGRVVGVLLLSRSARGLFKGLYADRGKILFGIGVILLLLVILSGVISRGVTRPIEQLGLATRAVSSGRGRVPDPPPTAAIEIQGLYADSAVMAAAIERRSRYLRDVAHAVGHEFKTPLAGIRGAVELPQEHPDMSAPDRRRSRSLLHAAGGTLALVDDPAMTFRIGLLERWHRRPLARDAGDGGPVAASGRIVARSPLSACGPIGRPLHAVAASIGELNVDARRGTTQSQKPRAGTLRCRHQQSRSICGSAYLSVSGPGTWPSTSAR